MPEEFGCSTLAFRKQSLDEALRRLARLGFHRVDIAIIGTFCPHYPLMSATAADDARLRERLDSLGLVASTLNVGSGVPLNGPDGPETESAFIRRALELAQRLGAYAITMPAGRRLDPAQRSPHVRVASAAIRGLADAAERTGVDLTLEAPHRGTLAETLSEVSEVLAGVDDRRVGVTLDTSHVLNGGDTLDEALRVYGERVRHVHLRDFRDGSIEVTPGKGVIDFGAFLTRLRSLGFVRPPALELEYHDLTPEETEGEIAFALRHLREQTD